jgi:hypothetical protein
MIADRLGLNAGYSRSMHFIAYPVVRPFDAQPKEALRSSDTSYCYDTPALFEAAMEQQWQQAAEKNKSRNVSVSRPPMPMYTTELVVKKKNGGEWTMQDYDLGNLELVLENRGAGGNAVGMVACLGVLRTVEYPNVSASEEGATRYASNHQLYVPNSGPGTFIYFQATVQRVPKYATARHKANPSGEVAEEVIRSYVYEVKCSGTMRVLVINDQRTMRQMVAMLYQKISVKYPGVNIECCAALSGEQAIRMCRTQRFHIITMDQKVGNEYIVSA